MQMKWKKTSAALLVATLTVTGNGYAWANENLFDTVDLSKLTKTTEETTETTTKTTEDSKSEVTTGDTVGLDIQIPEDYPAGNLEALSKAYENAGNETAKAAIKRNAERAIAKFEAAQQAESETPEIEEPKTEQPKEQPETEKPVVEAPKTEVPKEEQPKVEEVTSTKEQRKALQEEQKAERKALKEEHKEERKALQAEHKAEKHENKKNKKNED